MIGCEHRSFASRVEVTRITDEAGQVVVGFAAIVNVWCTDCAEEFVFLGLPGGVKAAGASCSADGEEARLAIAPRVQVEAVAVGGALQYQRRAQ